jgi:hypothetical protein
VVRRGCANHAGGHFFPDTQFGFRLARRALVPVLMAANDRFGFETESIFLAARHGFRIRFVRRARYARHVDSGVSGAINDLDPTDLRTTLKDVSDVT